MELSKTPRRVEPLSIEQQGEGFYAILSVATGRVLITNETGHTVLGLCDGERTGEQIAKEMQARFPSTPMERIHTDVQEFFTAATGKEVLAW